MSSNNNCLWFLVRARGNGCVDDDLGTFATEEAARAAIPSDPGIYQLWEERYDVLVPGTWDRDAGKCFRCVNCGVDPTVVMGQCDGDCEVPG